MASIDDIRVSISEMEKPDAIEHIRQSRANRRIDANKVRKSQEKKEEEKQKSRDGLMEQMAQMDEKEAKKLFMQMKKEMR